MKPFNGYLEAVRWLTKNTSGKCSFRIYYLGLFIWEGNKIIFAEDYKGIEISSSFIYECEEI